MRRAPLLPFAPLRSLRRCCTLSETQINTQQQHCKRRNRARKYKISTRRPQPQLQAPRQRAHQQKDSSRQAVHEPRPPAVTRNSVDGDDDMSTGSASTGAAAALVDERCHVTKQGYRLLSTQRRLLAGVVVQNAALNVTARWSRVEALHREARGECHASPGAVVLVIELMKIVLALVLLAVEIKGNPIISVMKTTVTHPLDCLKVIVPAVLYVIQNQLLLVAAANLEAPVLGLFGQLKILTTALFSVALLGSTLGKRRWVALVVLTAGIATVQASQMHSDGSGDAGEKNVPLGLMMISIVASLSGFAGVYFEKVLKGSPISLWTRNVHLALFSVATVGLQVVSGDFEEACPHSLIEYLAQGLGPVAWAYVIIQAAGGLLIAAVIKYADNILKAFATSVAILVIALVSSLFFGFALSGLFFMGAAGVISSIFLYGDLLKDLGPCGKSLPWLGGQERPSTPRGV